MYQEKSKMCRKLLEFRRQYKLSRAEIARLLGMSENAYSARERGERQFSLSDVIEISNILALTDNEIIDAFFIGNGYDENDVITRRTAV